MRNIIAKNSIIGIGILALGLASCNEEQECKIDRVLQQANDGNGREVVTHASLILRRKNSQWVAERILRARKWQDGARHMTATGVAELYTASNRKPIATVPAEGTFFFEGQSFRSIPFNHDRVKLAREVVLEGTGFLLRLPQISNLDLKFANKENFYSEETLIRHVKWKPAMKMVDPRHEDENLDDDHSTSFVGNEMEFDLSELPEPEEDLTAGRSEDYTYRTREGLYSNIPVEAVHWSGNPQHRLNFLILPDGYTEAEMPIFKQKAAEMTRNLLGNHRPYSDFRSMINVIRVDIPSNDSGADCDDGKYTPRDNRYGSAFPVACINAMVGTRFNDRFLYQFKPANVERDSLSIYFDGVSVADEVFVMVHSPKRGGAAIIWANQTDTTGWSTAAHEIGHSLGRLGDEYLNQGDICHLYMGLARNLSLKKTEKEDVKWSHWLLDGTPLPTPDDALYDRKIGLFQGGAGGCKRMLYRPARSCKMRYSSKPFCSVCNEQMILRFYDRMKLIQGPLVRNGTEVTAPVGLKNRLLTRWYVDKELVQETHGYQPYKDLSAGQRDVQLVVFDEKAGVRRDRCQLAFSIKARL